MKKQKTIHWQESQKEKSYCFCFFKPRLLLTGQEVEEKKHEDGWKEVTQGSAGNQHT